MDSKIKLTRILNSVKHITTKGCDFRIKNHEVEYHTYIYTRDGLTDFCNLVKYQQCNPNIPLHEAFESMVYMTKFN